MMRRCSPCFVCYVDNWVEGQVWAESAGRDAGESTRMDGSVN